MNVGLDKATGEYIGIVEPDDFVPLYMYEDLYNVAAKNELDFVKADFYRFTRNDENGNMNLVYNHLDKTAEWYNKVFNPSQEPETLRFIMNTWSGIYRRDFWNSIISDIMRHQVLLSRIMDFIFRHSFMPSVR